MLTSEQLAEIGKRAERAAPGPWHRYESLTSLGVIGGLVGPNGEAVWDGYAGTMPDRVTLDFIAAARTDIPVLLEHIQALERMLAEAQDEAVALRLR